jgi:hypothetical protein
VLANDDRGGWRDRQQAWWWQRRTVRRVEWGEIAMVEWPWLLPWVTAARKKGTGIGATARGGSGYMGYMWSGGGGRSADSADARWPMVTKPPRHHRARVGALWLEHAAMVHRGPLASGPCHSKSSLNYHNLSNSKRNSSRCQKFTKFCRSIG